MSKVLEVPVILQMESIECGAACLAMILAYHKKYIPLEKLRIDCGISRDGSNAKNIALAAQKYGLEVNGYRLEPEELRAIPLPAIIHWEFNHFVVLNGFKKSFIVINDPVLGNIEVSYEDFDRSFTGVVLTFEKSGKFEKGGAKSSVLTFFKSQAGGQMLAFCLLLMLGVVIGITGVMPSIYVKIFIDHILFERKEEWLMPLLTAMLATFAVSFAATAAKQHLLMNMKAKLGAVFSANYMWHVLRLPIDFFSVRFSSDLANRQMDHDSIVHILCEKLVPIGFNFIMLIFYLLVMVKISIAMTLAGVAVTGINLAAILFASKKRINAMRVLKRDEGTLTGVTTSVIEQMEIIKAKGSEQSTFSRWAGYYTKRNNDTVSYIKHAHKMGQIPRLISDIFSLVVLTMGIDYILLGSLTIGTFIAFQGIMSLFITPIADIAESVTKTQEAYGKIERIKDVLNYPIDSRYHVKSETEKKLNTVELIDVCFGYSPLSAPTLKNISFKVHGGQLFSIVGPSGSGKSTLYKLIAGLQKAWSGKVSLNGMDIDYLSAEHVTSFLAVVNQDSIMFSGTIWENITLWDTSLSRSDILCAAKDADIHEFIMERPDGYDSKVLEDGRNLSAGQRQRLEIARALCRNPSILILDEATSALDTKSEMTIINSIKNRGITCIVISHRLSAIRDSDMIVVIDNGEIIERGTNDALIAFQGIYANLINSEMG